MSTSTGRGACMAALWCVMWIGACDPAQVPMAPVDGTDLDARMADVATALEASTDPEVLAAAVFVTPEGCEEPRWAALGVPLYDDLQGGRGLTLMDRAAAPQASTVQEGEPNQVTYHLDDDGHLHRAGAGWYGVVADTQGPPSLFDLSEEEAELAWQADPGMWWTHAWLWSPSPDSTLGWFGAFNEDLQAPTWYAAGAGALRDAALAFDPVLAANRNFPPAVGACIVGADGDVGYPRTSTNLVGQLDPSQPDTLLYDAGGRPLAVQWTWPDDGAPPPDLFGLPLHGPDADGHYTLRAWVGERINPRGYFHPSLPSFSCAAPPPPPACHRSL